jgi:hypothetical protein
VNIISSMVILYSDNDDNDDMFGDFNIYQFIMSILTFVLSIMFFLNFSSNLNSILLG